MKRFALGFVAIALGVAPMVRAQSPGEMAQTSRYVEALQNPDGGFGPAVGQPSSLGTTSSAVRVLKNTGGSIPDVLACIKYIKSCHDPESGGFAPKPGGKPDVRTTAVGLMAIVEMKISADKITEPAIAYFSKNVKSFEDIRIAVAGLEAVDGKSPDFEAWTKQVVADRNPDGTFGKGPSKPRDTGGAAAALLRMGVKLDKAEAVIDALKEGQQADGAWSKGEQGSDLEATYRIMRCLYMLKAKPDLEKLSGFLASCRHSSGGYGVKPGAAPDLGGTYFATTVGRWVRLMNGEPALVETAGFVPLFNGKDLNGWEGNTELWSARDGMLIGTSPGLEHNDFLAATGTYGDFILKLTFRLKDDEGNTGVQFRSVRVPGHEMSGYQADIGQGYWGCLYDESRRNRVLVKASEKALDRLHKKDWNEYNVRAIGDDIRLSLNGVGSVDYKETDPKIAREGRIAVQIHGGGPMEVRFKDIYIQPLPRPVAGLDVNTPGFHLRTLKTGSDERKYTLSVPKVYDGQKALPAVLFLHGSGERGEDGIVSAQVGLGAAIAANPEAFPFLAIFPQARKTWSADSDDAKAALATLDDVAAAYKVDRNRVILTGLSMGGRGAWEIAAAHPETFAAVVPVCGMGRTESAEALKALPVWAFVGDADNTRTVLNTRAMVEALRSAGGKVKETEYRGVGHNSWDRAYNNLGLVAWMLAQSHR
jgi:poly(3-hydroxybutyrate) depolymerase